MTQHVYRDVAVASGPEFIANVVVPLAARGWSRVAWSDGSARSTDFSSLTGAPAYASALGANGAWVLLSHTASGRKLSFKRTSDANNWLAQYTLAGVSLSPGDGSNPDSHADTKTFFSGQLYPSSAPTACKLHVVADDSKAGFVALLRRTPYPGGDACSWLFVEAFASSLAWADDPDPCVVGGYFADDNGACSRLFGNSLSAWYRRGLAGQDFPQHYKFENVFGSCGSATAFPGGVDAEMQMRVGRDVGGAGYPMGLSTLIKGLNPYREPTTGVNSGGTLNRAAFGAVTVANDGVALGS